MGPGIVPARVKSVDDIRPSTEGAKRLAAANIFAQGSQVWRNTKDALQAARSKPGCHDFIENLPNKYDTLIGEDGVRLSGGEKQRISIARAFLRKSKIILLDEPTSSLDSETENKIQLALNKLTENKTTIVIAHRLSTILSANKIFVIDNGNVVSTGTHSELLNNSEIYNNFYNKQIKNN